MIFFSAIDQSDVPIAVQACRPPGAALSVISRAEFGVELQFLKGFLGESAFCVWKGIRCLAVKTLMSSFEEDYSYSSFVLM